MSKSIWSILLTLCATVSLVLAIIAEHNEEYARATYEMMWVFFFMVLIDKEKLDE